MPVRCRFEALLVAFARRGLPATKPAVLTARTMKRGRLGNRVLCLCTWHLPCACLLVAMQVQCKLAFTSQHKRTGQLRGWQWCCICALASQQPAYAPPAITKPGAFKETKMHTQQQIWYCCVVQYHASSMAAHLPHRQLFGQLLALPAPGRSPLNTYKLPFCYST